MFQNQLYAYIRENEWMLAAVAAAVLLFLLLLILFQVSRTRREVHKICKKVRRYFEVILSEPQEKVEPQREAAPREEEEQSRAEIPVYRISGENALRQESGKKEEKQLKEQRDAKLLMDIIQEVF